MRGERSMAGCIYNEFIVKFIACVRLWLCSENMHIKCANISAQRFARFFRKIIRNEASAMC